MTDMFTITREYDRDEILETAKTMIEKGGDIFQTKDILDQFFPAWRMDTRTSCMVELMFRDENDIFYELFTTKLAELDEARRMMLLANEYRL